MAHAYPRSSDLLDSEFAAVPYEGQGCASFRRFDIGDWVDCSSIFSIILGWGRARAGSRLDGRNQEQVQKRRRSSTGHQNDKPKAIAFRASEVIKVVFAGGSKPGDGGVFCTSSLI